MAHRKIILTAYACLLSLVLILGAKIAYSKDDAPVLQIIFLNVGQGDSILIKRGDAQILIDGGANGKILMEKLGKYIPFWDRDMEIVVATHPDQDHIAGLIDVIANYNVKQFINNGVSSESQAYKKLQDTAANMNVNRLEGSAGTKIKLADSIQAEILSPDGSQAKDNPKDTNASSLVIKLTYGENSFLFAGDATTESEKKLLETDADIPANILKVGHHGSKYSTTDEFLDKVRPREAVISVGKNSYGHPAPEIINKLEDRNIEILRTDERGDIIYECENNVCILSN